ncbi:MAG: DUF4160 domain-containing protein [Deltaproteobacteria bacterium]|nr:MAG: DUF4160 domain-containing protein [Deltaproteobacteria bacterium]
MFVEIGGPHHRPHLLPRRQRRLVEAWGELHQEELMADWDRLQAGRPPQPIEPLQ